MFSCYKMIVVNRSHELVVCILLMGIIRSHKAPHSKRAINFSKRIPEHKLAGQLIKTVDAKRAISCAGHCRLTQDCVSFNFCGQRICELNRAAVHDVEQSLLEYSRECSYFGVESSCTNTTLVHVDKNSEGVLYEWSEWVSAVKVDNGSMWKKVSEKTCLRNGFTVADSHCVGCRPNSSVLELYTWELTPMTWDASVAHCLRKGGQVFAELSPDRIAFVGQKLGEWFRLGVKEDENYVFWSVSGQDVTNAIMWDWGEPTNEAHSECLYACTECLNARQLYAHDAACDWPKPLACDLGAV